jgi:hypothetical protein
MGGLDLYFLVCVSMTGVNPVSDGLFLRITQTTAGGGRHGAWCLIDATCLNSIPCTYDVALIVYAVTAIGSISCVATAASLGQQIFHSGKLWSGLVCAYGYGL